MINIQKIGINGFGRIGKLTVWHQIANKNFEELVINVGRKVGTSLNDIAHYVERDSTYGSLQSFLYGFKGKPVVSDINEKKGTMKIDSINLKFLRDKRNPSEIKWKENDVKLVVDTTGQFLDPTLEEDDYKGSIRGHIKAGAEKVILSAPFKIKDSNKKMPEDAVTTIMGINGNDYKSYQHVLISNASCTTTCLAHMIKPMLDKFGMDKIISASMATIHAATGSQKILDSLVKIGKKDLRKNRSTLNNIILTTTGAVKALGLVLPEINNIDFIAESIRVPINTGSLIILVLNIQNEDPIDEKIINNLYKETASKDTKEYLLYSEKQNVSSDIIGIPKAATIIEAHETQCRTTPINIDLNKIVGINKKLSINVTQTVIYGWYDNELGSYVNMLGDRILSVAETI